MTKLAINFVKRSHVSTWVGWCLCIAGACTTCLVAWNYAEAQTELEQVQTRLARIQRSTAAPRPAVTAPAAQRDEEKSLLSARSQLRLPWNGLLTELDLASSPNVALLSVESQGQTRELRMSGEAQSMTDVVAYVNQLRQSPLLESVYLSQHETKKSGPVDLIRFSLNATWRTTP